MIQKDLDSYLQPYKKLQSVEELQTANALLDYYIKAYRKKYKTDPVFENSNNHINLIKDISKTAKEKAFLIVDQYFKMDPDGWYSKHGHSLDILKRNINAVNAALGRLHAHTLNQGGVLIYRMITCPNCKKYGKTRAVGPDDEPPIFCEKCTA